MKHEIQIYKYTNSNFQLKKIKGENTAYHHHPYCDLVPLHNHKYKHKCKWEIEMTNTNISLITNRNTRENCPDSGLQRIS